MSEDPSSARRLLTFRLDTEQRQRLKARLAADGKTMSEVITHGLHLYVKTTPTSSSSPADSPVAAAFPVAAAAQAPAGAQALVAAPGPAAAQAPAAAPADGRPTLPEATAARLRELRASGRSGVLSATLAALHEAGWPLPALAEALAVSRQAIQVRVRQRVPAEFRDRTVDYAPPPPFPRRRAASKGRLRPHLTIKIDQALRAAAHRAAAREGNSLSQVVEAILDRYLRSPPRDS
jgi:antitoxin component of RelBE/YafQ-DinJ toxin-antitoxin module